MATAALGTLIGNTIFSMLATDNTFLAVVGEVIAFTAVALAQAAVLVMAVGLQRNEPPNVAAAYGTALGLGARYVPATGLR